MNSLQYLSARLSAFIVTHSGGSDRDRGEGPVSYIAVVLLIAVIALAVAGSGIGTTIVGFISSAVSKVWTDGGGAGSSAAA
ncbi:hypothetical protein [Actinomadura sp. 9N407]|uniref:hypothetical protein n=1 Tax=Actinomadura sp. 9N407 TaxID=3375154 RepID=UPI00379F66B1